MKRRIPTSRSSPVSSVLTSGLRKNATPSGEDISKDGSGSCPTLLSTSSSTVENSLARGRTSSGVMGVSRENSNEGCTAAPGPPSRYPVAHSTYSSGGSGSTSQTHSVSQNVVLPAGRVGGIRANEVVPVAPPFPRPQSSGGLGVYGSGGRGGRRVIPSAPAPRASTAHGFPTANRLSGAIVGAGPLPASQQELTPTPPTHRPATAAIARQSPSPQPLSYLVPPPREVDEGKLVVVLDLDETLIFSRGNRVFERQGVSKLLQTLKGRCEVIVWTAGTRDYALDVIRIIDPYFAIQHCIYRHPMWWNGEIGCTKDLRMLGRPMERVILIDNTPEVFRENPENGILVSDFLGREATGGRSDRTLSILADIFEYVLRHLAEPKTADVLASHRLHTRTFRLDGKRRVEIFTVVGDRHEAARL